MRGDRVVGRAAAAQEPVGVRGAGDAHHQAAGRQRRPVDRRGPPGPQRHDALVRAKSRPDEAGALEQAEESSFHARGRYTDALNVAIRAKP